MTRNSLGQWDRQHDVFESESEGHFETEAGAMSSQERSRGLDSLHASLWYLSVESYVLNLCLLGCTARVPVT